jgi:hypothetical protein
VSNVWQGLDSLLACNQVQQRQHVRTLQPATFTFGWNMVNTNKVVR